ncbi:MAG: YbjN domain-containing protein [Actinomycetota bacterium]
MDAAGPLDPQERQQVHDLVAMHLEGSVAAEPWVQAVEYDASIPRWYVRFGCDGRDAATIYLDIHQRTLRAELYFLPDPPANHEALYRFLLRCNHDRYGVHFSIGPDGDCYLVGRVLLDHLDVAELDRLIGACYEVTERWFTPAVRIAFGARES